MLSSHSSVRLLQGREIPSLEIRARDHCAQIWIQCRAQGMPYITTMTMWGKAGCAELIPLYSDLLTVWQSVSHMRFISHTQFQQGRVSVVVDPPA